MGWSRALKTGALKTGALKTGALKTGALKAGAGHADPAPMVLFLDPAARALSDI